MAGGEITLLYHFCYVLLTGVNPLTVLNTKFTFLFQVVEILSKNFLAPTLSVMFSDLHGLAFHQPLSL